MDDTIKLRVINMTKLYNNGDGVKNVDLDVHTGELVTLLGPSGCGKTTILRTIGGFIDLTDGDITIDGKSIITLPPEKRSARGDYIYVSKDIRVKSYACHDEARPDTKLYPADHFPVTAEIELPLAATDKSSQTD